MSVHVPDIACLPAISVSVESSRRRNGTGLVATSRAHRDVAGRYRNDWSQLQSATVMYESTRSKDTNSESWGTAISTRHFVESVTITIVSAAWSSGTVRERRHWGWPYGMTRSSAPATDAFSRQTEGWTHSAKPPMRTYRDALWAGEPVNYQVRTRGCCGVWHPRPFPVSTRPSISDPAAQNFFAVPLPNPHHLNYQQLVRW